MLKNWARVIKLGRVNAIQCCIFLERSRLLNKCDDAEVDDDNIQCFNNPEKF